MNAEVAEAVTWTGTGTEVGQDVEVTLVTEEGLHQEAEGRAAAIRETWTGEKEDVSAVRREDTSGLTALATPVVAGTLASSIGEEMTVLPPTVVMVDLEMVRAEESHQEADHLLL